MIRRQTKVFAVTCDAGPDQKMLLARTFATAPQTVPGTARIPMQRAQVSQWG